jgi:hypothetical protein
LFGITHKQAKQNVRQELIDADYDDIVEFAVTSLVNSITKAASEEKIIISGENSAKGTGKQLASIVDSKPLVEAAVQRFKKKANRDAARSSMLQSFENFGQKIDVKIGTIKFKGEVEGSQEFQKLASLLSGHTYTIKNYMESTILSGGIEIGDAAQDYKSVMGTLTALGYDQSEREHEWYHMFHSSQKNTEGFISHKRHLQMTYELMGTGLIDSEGNLIPVAEFLILQRNKDGGDSAIEVYSTAALIEQYIAGKYTGLSLRESLLHEVMNSVEKEE